MHFPRTVFCVVRGKYCNAVCNNITQLEMNDFRSADKLFLLNEAVCITNENKMTLITVLLKWI